MIALHLGMPEQEALERLLQNSGSRLGTLQQPADCVISAYDDDRLVGIAGWDPASAQGEPACRFLIDPEYEARDLRSHMRKLLAVKKGKTAV